MPERHWLQQVAGVEVVVIAVAVAQHSDRDHTAVFYKAKGSLRVE